MIKESNSRLKILQREQESQMREIHRRIESKVEGAEESLANADEKYQPVIMALSTQKGRRGPTGSPGPPGQNGAAGAPGRPGGRGQVSITLPHITMRNPQRILEKSGKGGHKLTLLAVAVYSLAGGAKGSSRAKGAQGEGGQARLARQAWAEGRRGIARTCGCAGAKGVWP
jgi:hypothetical protein